MASFGKVLDLLDDRYLNLQDVFGNVEPLPTLVPHEQYLAAVPVYRMHIDHDVFIGLMHDFTARMAKQTGKELWTWYVQWEVDSTSDMSLEPPTPKKARLNSGRVKSLPAQQPQPKAPIIDIFDRRVLDPELHKEEDMLRILIDIVQVDSSLVPNFIEFLYRWIDYYEGDGKALKAALKWEIPSLWDFEYHPLVLPNNLEKKTEQERVNPDDDQTLSEDKEAQEITQHIQDKMMRKKPDLAALERSTAESERLQYREVKYGIQPPKLTEPLPPLINVPREHAKRVKYYAACFRSRQRAVVLLLETGLTMRQISNYKKLQGEHPKDTPEEDGPSESKGLANYHKDAAAAQEHYLHKERLQQWREKQKEIALSNKLALEAQLGEDQNVTERIPSKAFTLPTANHLHHASPDSVLATLKAKRADKEDRINVVPTPLVGLMKSNLFKGATDRQALEDWRKSSVAQKMQMMSESSSEDDMTDGSDSDDGDDDPPPATIRALPANLSPSTNGPTAELSQSSALPRLPTLPSLPTLPTLPTLPALPALPALPPRPMPSQYGAHVPPAHAIPATAQPDPNNSSNAPSGSLGQSGAPPMPASIANIIQSLNSEQFQRLRSSMNEEGHEGLTVRAGSTESNPHLTPQAGSGSAASSHAVQAGSLPQGVGFLHSVQGAVAHPSQSLTTSGTLQPHSSTRTSQQAPVHGSTQPLASPLPPPSFSVPHTGQQQQLHNSGNRGPIPTLTLSGPGVQRTPPTPLDLTTPAKSPMSSLAPQLLATTPFTSSPHGFPVQIFFPGIVFPRNGIGPGGAPMGNNAATETDAMLLGYSQPGSGKIVLNRAIFLPVGVGANTELNMQEGKYEVLDTYGQNRGAVSHKAAYEKLLLAYNVMRSSTDREAELTKRWRATQGPMTLRDRGAVWEGWGVTLDQGIEMSREDRKEAFRTSYWIDEGTKRKKAVDEYEERRRREIDEMLEDEDNWDEMEVDE